MSKEAASIMIFLTGTSFATSSMIFIWLSFLCWIDGDSEIKSNDDYLIPASTQALVLMKTKGASIKKK